MHSRACLAVLLLVATVLFQGCGSDESAETITSPAGGTAGRGGAGGAAGKGGAAAGKGGANAGSAGTGGAGTGGTAGTAGKGGAAGAGAGGGGAGGAAGTSGTGGTGGCSGATISWPGAKLAASPTTGGLVLTWSAATSTSSLQSYLVLRDGKQIATAPASSLTATVPAPVPGQPYVYKVEATDACSTSKDGPSAPVNLPLPKDPSTTKPALVAGEISSFCERNRFLWSGPDAVQTVGSASAIECRRGTLLRGRVTSCDGKALPGARVSVPLQPEIGFTYSRADGLFDLVVNGGGDVTLRYEREGSPSVDRRVETGWNEYRWAPDVVLLPYDPKVTEVAFDSMTGLMVVRGSPVSDSDGVRQATLLFPEGEKASLKLPDGTAKAASTIHVRATEYTVGACGPKAMPALLPPSSAYTFATEFSVDEGVAVGAVEVAFEKPVIAYVENFVGFSVGGKVPVGSYDRAAECWVPGANGRVIAIVGVAGGVADVDTDGDGKADSDGGASAGITAAERTALGGLYKAGQELWRVELKHFSPWDFNWSVPPPIPPPPDAPDPKPVAQTPGELVDEDCLRGGSIIGCHSQNLGEVLPLGGTRDVLAYSSYRVPGANQASITVPVSGTTIPSGLLSMQAEVEIAGQIQVKDLPAAANQSWTFGWDGLDGFGRPVYGAQRVRVLITWFVASSYAEPSDMFGRAPGGALVKYVKARQAIGGTKQWWGTITAKPPVDLSGWSLSNHHRYDPVEHAVHYGDGRKRVLKAGATDALAVSTIAGSGPDSGPCQTSGDGGSALQARLCAPTGLAVGPDGSVYIADADDHRIRKVAPDGTITTIAGTGQESPCAGDGDGGSALKARIQPGRMALDCKQNLYFVDRETRVRRIDRAGVISTVVGSGCSPAQEPPVLGLPGESTKLRQVIDIVAGPDCRMYVADNDAQRVVALEPDGIVRAIAGNGDFAEPKLGLAAIAGPLPLPWGLALGRDGTLFIAGGTGKPGEGAGVGPWDIYRVRADGVLNLHAGGGSFSAPPGDGASALGAYFSNIDAMVASANGVYVANGATPASLSFIDAAGKVHIVAGGTGNTPMPHFSGDGPARESTFWYVPALALGPDGSVYAAEYWSRRVFRVHPVDPKVRAKSAAPASPAPPPPPPGEDGELMVPAEEGGTADIFNEGNGRHLRTVDTLSGVVLSTRAYDAGGRLISITDQFGNVTKLVRDAEGRIATVVSPWGMTTKLAYDAGGWLATVTNDAGESFGVSHSPLGLLASVTSPAGKKKTFEYDGAGRLLKDLDPGGGSQTVTRKDGVTTVTTGLGRATKYDRSTDSAQVRTDTMTVPGGHIVVAKSAPSTPTTVTQPDGTSLTVDFTPDPVLGSMAPYAKSMTVATGGMATTYDVEQSATLSDLGNPLSVAIAKTSVSSGNLKAETTYDAATRKLSAITGAGRAATITFNDLGVPVSVARPGALPVALQYDGQGRLTKATQGARTSSRTYDSRGLLATTTDTLGRTEAYEYDLAGRLAKGVLQDGSVVSMTYDQDGNLSTITPPSRPAHAFGYTANDQVSSTTAPAVSSAPAVTSYTYNLDHQLTGITRADGKQVVLAYSAESGRMTSVTLPGTEGAFTFAEDLATGHLVGMQGPEGETITQSYKGSLLAGVTWSGPVAGKMSWAYDSSMRLIEEGAGDFDSALMKYDADGLLVIAGLSTLTREATSGRVASATAGGFSEVFTYDADFGEVASLTTSGPAGVLHGNVYGRDVAGRITTRIETILGATATYTYTYDKRDHLMTVSKDGLLVVENTYDANGNRTQRKAGGQTSVAQYDVRDRLVSVDGATYTYSAGGELISRTSGTETTNFDHDGLGNLRGVTLPGGKAITYVLDPLGRRVGRKVDGVITQRYLYKPDGRLAAIGNAGGGTDAFFVYGAREHVPDYMTKSFAMYRLVVDHLGSVRLVLDASGAVVQRLDYDEMGRVVLDTNPGFQPFGYAGGLYDWDTKLVRFGVRDYDAETGRWITADPIGFGGGDTNVYAYVGSNPINAIDPSGMVIRMARYDTPEKMQQAPIEFALMSTPLPAVATLRFLGMVPVAVWRGAAVLMTLGVSNSNDWEGHFAVASIAAGGMSTPAMRRCPITAGATIQTDTALHHVFPQAFKDWFKKKGIDIHKWTVDIPTELHAEIHAGSRSQLPFNTEWDAWIKANPKATASEIYAKGAQMVHDYNFEEYLSTLGPYARP